MTAAAASPVPILQVDERVATAVRTGLACRPKWIPAWLFYDRAGSRLFEAITELDEYYLTRTERSILAQHCGEIVARAGERAVLRIAELGAGSAEKTRLLLRAAVRRQGSVLYEPIDVSSSALTAAKRRIEREMNVVAVAPRVMDYTDGDARRLHLAGKTPDEKRLVLYIGSSIGNFEPTEAEKLLHRVRAGLDSGDSMLLGVDLVKDEAMLVAAYDDAEGVTAAFNKNVLVRLNRELDADFDVDTFAHRAVWNQADSRVEMHLVSAVPQQVRLEALDMTVDFAAGESIHTESSYKYRPGQAEALLERTGFSPDATWTDARGWFAVCLGRAR
ncbi:MAG TPA: L-histidine N(alpha)-methyltransferase [Terracidiphilus sp.]|nr:L-histidine N(alpha)-methyltransferase [Terracidiphilus sp.]